MRIEESLEASAGRADLRDHTVVGRDEWRAAGSPTVGHAVCIASLIRAVRSASRVDDLEAACRSTMIAVMGRMAAVAPGPVAWRDIWPHATSSSPLRPLQCAAV